MNPYLKQYQQTQINTTPKEQILLMLYDGAVRFLKQAKEVFAEKNIEKIHNNIIKVQNILIEFETSLDMENGGDFAKNLFGLYEFMSQQLSIANIKKKEESLDIVLKHMTELRDTWREAVKKSKSEGNTLLENDVDRYNKTGSIDENTRDIGEYI